jgi:8-oxo-dGTP pyrophosphatase MutT (NUDIX family)
MPQEHSVGVILFNKDKYLLLRYASGHWGYVKGNIEKNEQTEDTARRELKEETGITTVFFVKGFEEKEEYFYKKEGKTIHKQVDYLLGETQETEVTLSLEHKDFKWLSYQEAMNQLTFAAGKELLKKAEEYKKYH